MPLFLDTRGQPTLGIGICARCSRKMPLAELHSDPNAPGLMVCVEDLDQYDPYRLAPRATEDIALKWARPDVSLYVGPVQDPVLPLQAAYAPAAGELLSPVPEDGLGLADPVSRIQPSTPWAPNTSYPLGAQVTPTVAVGMDAANTTIYVFTAVIPGVSGSTTPAWTDFTGTVVVDGGVTWICAGLYLT